MAAEALKTRVLTALLLAPLFVAAVLLLRTEILAVVLAVVVLLAADEWAALGDLRERAHRLAFVAYQGGLLGAAYLLLDRPEWLIGLMGLAVAWWVAAGIASIGRRSPVAAQPGPRPWLLAAAPALCALAWLALVRLHGAGDAGPALVLALLVVIWAADTGAYFAGRALGRRHPAGLQVIEQRSVRHACRVLQSLHHLAHTLLEGELRVESIHIGVAVKANEHIDRFSCRNLGCDRGAGLAAPVGRVRARFCGASEAGDREQQQAGRKLLGRHGPTSIGGTTGSVATPDPSRRLRMPHAHYNGNSPQR